MADIKIGDKVTVVGGSPADRVYTVWGVHEEFVWLDSSHTAHGWLALADKVTKVEPFFEPGKAYITAFDETFECEKVLVEGDDTRIAFGKYRPGTRPKDWSFMLAREFSHWTEKGPEVS